MSKLFFGGVPTGPDVDNLMKLEIVPGSEVSYAVIEEIISARAGSSRFRTVTSVWRKRIFRHRQIVSKAEGASIRFLTADEASDASRDDMHKIGRATGRAYTRVSSIKIEELTAQKREGHRLVVKEFDRMMTQAQQSAKAIAAPIAIKSVRLVATEKT